MDELFGVFSVGVGTKVDNISIDFGKNKLSERINDILENKYSRDDLISKFDLGKNTTWEYEKALQATFSEDKISDYDYRPFDQRHIFYDHNFLSRSRKEVMDNFFGKENYGLELGRTSFVSFVSKNISDEHFGGPKSYKFPMYIYSEDGAKGVNFERDIVSKIEEVVGKIKPEEIFDYIYAVLHSPKYREKYKEFLKIDFPRVPYPEDKKEFQKLVKLGGELRELHLMESDKLNKLITTYPEGGNNEVGKVVYKDGNVYINNNQYFGKVPEIAWNFYIGGYQPTQKWLKDRKGRKLTNAEIEHYQKIIIALVETDKIMKQIDS
jgi:predicted helicase